MHENAMLREQQQMLLKSHGHHSGSLPNGVEDRSRVAALHARGARNSGGARPQSMFEPRDQERLSQKSNRVSFARLRESD